MSVGVMLAVLGAVAPAATPDFQRLDLQIFDAVDQWGGVGRRPAWMGTTVGLTVQAPSGLPDGSGLALLRLSLAATPEVGVGVTLPMTATTQLGGGGPANLGFDADYLLIDRARYRLGLRGEVWIPTAQARNRAAFVFSADLPAVAPHTTTVGVGTDAAWAPSRWLLLTGHLAVHGHHVGGPTGGAAFASVASGGSVAAPIFLGGTARGHRFFLTPGCEIDAFSVLDSAGSSAQLRVTPGVSLGWGFKRAEVTREGVQGFLASVGYQVPVADAGATAVEASGRVVVMMRMQYSTARAKYEVVP